MLALGGEMGWDRVMSERDSKWNVEHWMTDVALAISPNTSASAAMLKMHIGRFRHLPVVDSGRLIGIVSDRDLIGSEPATEEEIKRAYVELDDSPTVSEVMSREPETTSPTVPLEEAIAQLLEHKYSALPVTDSEGHLVGILTTHDILRASQEALARLRNL